MRSHHEISFQEFGIQIGAGTYGDFNGSALLIGEDDEYMAADIAECANLTEAKAQKIVAHIVTGLVPNVEAFHELQQAREEALREVTA